MSKYMLITVCERDIHTEQFDNFDDARNQMIKELRREVVDILCELPEVNDVIDENGDCDEEDVWNEIKKRDKYAYSCYNGFAFGRDWGWSNVDDDCKFDWLIVEVQ